MQHATCIAAVLPQTCGMSSRDEPPVPARSETLRAALREVLRGPYRTLHELSGELRASEREVLEHLEHLELSLQHTQERLEIEPARCLACGFSFDTRTRLKKPGRCPACRATRIAPPRFSITAKD